MTYLGARFEVLGRCDITAACAAGARVLDPWPMWSTTPYSGFPNNARSPEIGEEFESAFTPNAGDACDHRIWRVSRAVPQQRRASLEALRRRRNDACDRPRRGPRDVREEVVGPPGGSMTPGRSSGK